LCDDELNYLLDRLLSMRLSFVRPICDVTKTVEMRNARTVGMNVPLVAVNRRMTDVTSSGVIAAVTKTVVRNKTLT